MGEIKPLVRTDGVDVGARISALGRLLRPHRVVGKSKRRVGRVGDGGYVCVDDFDGVTGAFSLGIAGEVSWDLEVANLGIPVHQFDHSVNQPPVANPNFHFHRSKIGSSLSEEVETIDSIVKKYSSGGTSNNIIKIDIEGDEWDALCATSERTLRSFGQILCEFHSFSNVNRNEWWERAFVALTRLQKYFAVVHVHANNWAHYLNVGGVPFPDVIEVSFASRKRFKFAESDEIFPTILDFPNKPAVDDYYLGNFVFDEHFSLREAGPSNDNSLAFRAFVDRIRGCKRGLVVASSQRCGTHLLGSYLSNSGVGRPGEHFLPLIDTYREGKPGVTKLRTLLDKISAEAGAAEFGICLMGYFDSVLDIIRQEGTNPRYLIDALKKFPWVWLRRDHFFVAVSHYFALATGAWDASVQHEAPPYDFAEIKKWWWHSLRVERYWQTFFAENNIDPMILWYAEMSPATGKLQDILERAGGDSSKLISTVPPRKMPHEFVKDEYVKRFRSEIGAGH